MIRSSPVDHFETSIERRETLEQWAESCFESDRVGGLQERVSSAREELSAAEDDAESSGALVVV